MFADLLKSLRAKKNISQTQLAKAVGVSNGNVGDWERGRSKPGYDAIIALARFFEVSTDYLLSYESEPHENEREPQMQLSKKEADLIAMFRELDDRDKEDAYDNIYHKYKRASKKEVSLYSTYGNESGEEMTPDIGKISNGNR